MKIQPLNLASYLPINNVSKNNYASTPLMSQGLKNDIFVKSNEVSFKSSSVKENVEGALIVGGAFLVPVLIGLSLAKHQHPEDIFTYDGQYICSVDKLYINEQKAKELGVDLSPERFKGANSFADPLNGIYKNEDKGVDIDLKAGKYIDAENGVFIEPESKTSVVFTGGDAVPIILLGKNPSFSGASVLHGGETNDLLFIKEDRNEFVKEHDGKGPEEFNKNVPWTMDDIDDATPNQDYLKIFTQQSLFKAAGIPVQPATAGYFPIDRRDFSEKLHDAILGSKDSSPYLHDYWGREIVAVKDSMDKTHYVALDEDLAQRVHDENISYETVQKFIIHAAEHPINNYAKINHWDNLHLLNPSVSTFLENINEHHSNQEDNDTDNINTDNYDTDSDLLNSDDYTEDDISDLN